MPGRSPMALGGERRSAALANGFLAGGQARGNGGIPPKSIFQAKYALRQYQIEVKFDDGEHCPKTTPLGL